jgi:hypothetical protein
MPLNGDRLRKTVTLDRLGEEAQGCRLVAVSRELEICRLPGFIHGTIALELLPVDAHGRFAHPPAAPHRPLAAVGYLLQRRTVLDAQRVMVA